MHHVGRHLQLYYDARIHERQIKNDVRKMDVKNVDSIYVAHDTEQYDVPVNTATKAWNRVEKRLFTCGNTWSQYTLGSGCDVTECMLTLILPRSRTGTVWFYTSTSNKRATRPKLYTKSLTGDLKLMYSLFTLVRISIKL